MTSWVKWRGSYPVERAARPGHDMQHHDDIRCKTLLCLRLSNMGIASILELRIVVRDAEKHRYQDVAGMRGVCGTTLDVTERELLRI